MKRDFEISRGTEKVEKVKYLLSVSECGNIKTMMRWQVQKRQNKVAFNILCIVILWNLLLQDAVDAKSLDYCKNN